MSSLLFLQILNGLQLGVLLFLIAAGLTLVFGVMNLINLAHGVQYMLGAYLAVAFYGLTGSFLVALVLALLATLAFALLLELLVFRQLYGRDHLDHVMATFGIILFVDQGVKLVWGAAPLSLPIPDLLSGSVVLMEGLLYPVWRLVVIGSGLPAAVPLFLLVGHTPAGPRSGSICWSATRASAFWCAPAPPTRRSFPRSASTSAGCSCWCSASAPCWRASPA